MEVLVGPTFTIENPSSPTTGQTDQRLFLNGINEVDQVPSTAFRRISEPPKFFARGSSESSSSIGTPDDSDNDDEEVQSDFNLKTTNAFSSLDSLEDSLPIKKGLSSHFDGKSKSFTDLSKVNSLNELNKQESPFNKRRRVLIASKFSRITRSSFYSWSNPQSMPLLPLDEEEDLDNNNNNYYYYQEYKARKLPYASSSSSSSSSLSEDKKQEAAFPQSHAAEMRLRLGSFNSRSYSLADLKEHDDDDEDDHED